MVEKFNNVLAIIPARAGSKRLPGKNKMRLSGGIPLWKNTVDIAMKAGIGSIIVSTDDREILDDTVDGVAIVERSKDAAGDNAAMDDVILDVLNNVPQDILFDTICLLQPTSPLLEASTLRYALNKLIDRHYHCIVAVNDHYKPCGAFYILRRNTFLYYKTIWMPGLVVHVVDDKEAVDIDNIWDLRIAEAIHTRRVIP